MSLLVKGAVETDSPAQSKSGFYSRYFLVPKKDGGLRPILDLGHLSRALIKRPFRIIALKQILSQVCLGDWLFLLNMKDAYFHIQIAPHHRRFLRFAFKGVAYQCTVVPFWAVPSSPHFYKVHGCGSFSAKTAGNTHLELLWRLAHPGPVGRWASISQIRAPQPIRVPRTQGQFCKKRAIHQPTNFIPGNSYRLSPNEGCGHARTCTGYSAAIQSIAPSKRLRGCWASWPQHLRYFSWACFKCGPFSTGWKLEFLHTLGITDASASRWARPALQGPFVRLGMVCCRKLVLTDAYVNRHRGLSSRRLFTLAEHLLRWAQLNLRSLRAAHVPEFFYLGADMLSWRNTLSDEWTLRPQTVQVIRGIFGRMRGRPLRLRRQHSLLKVYLAAIAASHAPIDLLINGQKLQTQFQKSWDTVQIVNKS